MIWQSCDAVLCVAGVFWEDLFVFLSLFLCLCLYACICLCGSLSLSHTRSPEKESIADQSNNHNKIQLSELMCFYCGY